jgi:Zn-dependent protease with chaperone function
MSLDGANRSFFAFVSLALLLGAYALCGVLGVVLMPLLGARAAGPGPAGPLGDLALLVMLILASALVLALLRVSNSLARQTLASRRLARRVRTLARAHPDRLTEAATRSGLRGRVLLVDASEPFSFVYGVLAPRVAVSHSLLGRLTDEELLAVLEHERYHVRNLDPLKAMLIRALLAALSFMPAFDSLHAHYTASRELAADRCAIAACGRRPLAGALLKVVRGPQWSELHLAASLGGHELLGLRLAQLETGAAPRLLQGRDLARIAISLLGSAALLLGLLVSIYSSNGAAGVDRVSSGAVASATLLDSLRCAAPFAGLGPVAYLAIALRARRSLSAATPHAL